MGTYKCMDPGRIAELYYRQISIAHARMCIAKLANWRLQISYRQ